MYISHNPQRLRFNWKGTYRAREALSGIISATSYNKRGERSRPYNRLQGGYQKIDSSLRNQKNYSKDSQVKINFLPLRSPDETLHRQAYHA